VRLYVSDPFFLRFVSICLYLHSLCFC